MNQIDSKYSSVLTFAYSEDVIKLENLNDSVEIINCWSCPNLKCIKSIPPNLKTLDCSFCNNFTLSGIHEFPKTLKKLFLSECIYIKKLPTLPEGLEELNCSFTEIDNLELPKSLKILSCISTNITSLNLHEGMEEIIVNGCKLKEISFPKSLIKASLTSCTTLELVDIPLNSNLVELHCSFCNIKSLDLQNSVMYLDCSNCKYINDISNAKKLHTLYMNYCINLKELDLTNTIVKNLFIKGCSNLTSLKLSVYTTLLKCNSCVLLNELNLPNSLLHLICNLTNIRTLVLPQNIEMVECKECNNLTEIKGNVNNLLYLDVSDCINLITIPKFKQIRGAYSIKHCYHLIYERDDNNALSLLNQDNILNITHINENISRVISNLYIFKNIIEERNALILSVNFKNTYFDYLPEDIYLMIKDYYISSITEEEFRRQYISILETHSNNFKDNFFYRDNDVLNHCHLIAWYIYENRIKDIS